MKMTSENKNCAAMICMSIAVAMITTIATATEMSLEQSGTNVVDEAEVKAAPGAIHMVWIGKETTEPEIVAMVDKQKGFEMNNASGDPSVKAVTCRTSRWTGILNIDEPGLYTFNVVYIGSGRDSTMSMSINSVHVIGFANRGTGSKNVQIPGPANIEVTLYSAAAHMVNNVLIRYKKAGTLDYTTIAPETLYHAVK